MKKLIWVDAETTGLDVDKDHLLEIAVVITDYDLNILDAQSITIYQSERILNDMNDWCKEHHTKSELIKNVRDSTQTLPEVEEHLVNFIGMYQKGDKSPMCGNNVSFDRGFIHKFMPNLEKQFHYRNIDVSTVKELVKCWEPGVAEGLTKTYAHRALGDILESIRELKYYRAQVFCTE